MHLKFRRDQPPSTDPTQHFPFWGCWGGLASLPLARPPQAPPRRGHGSASRQVPLPGPPPPAAPHLRRGRGSARHQRTCPRLPRGSGRAPPSRLGGGQGGQPPAFEPIYLNGRHRRVWRGRAAPSCANQLGETRMLQSRSAAGAAPIHRLTPPPPPHTHIHSPPWPYLDPSN